MPNSTQVNTAALIEAGRAARRYLPLAQAALEPDARRWARHLAALRAEVTDGAEDRRTVLVYTWTEAEGYPPHACGFVQVSLRPYRVTDGCDGSRDDQALYLLRLFLEAAGLELEGVWRAAYPDEVPRRAYHMWSCPAWVAREIEAPSLDAAHFALLCAGLYDMNYRSLAALLEEWAAQGRLQFPLDAECQ